RGYYTGIFGIFDGDSLESAVNIRYIENTAQGLMYRSGGGITALSNEEEEYRELLNKVYVPAF
ncbi:MAG TPA: chorismate-binding protein, partial [Bacteroidales bacterium]|nr:chorismate-binding protein [Bacteroidales bacterium]